MEAGERKVRGEGSQGLAQQDWRRRCAKGPSRSLLCCQTPRHPHGGHQSTGQRLSLHQWSPALASDRRGPSAVGIRQQCPKQSVSNLRATHSQEEGLGSLRLRLTARLYCCPQPVLWGKSLNPSCLSVPSVGQAAWCPFCHWLPQPLRWSGENTCEGALDAHRLFCWEQALFAGLNSPDKVC